MLGGGVTTIMIKDVKNTLKEARMKKLVLVMLALFLVIPALSNAGSVTSRYDVTFGGFVKMDFGYSSQNSHADPARAARSSTSVNNVYADEFSNTFMTAGETRFNFLVKGPDLWGAKTTAFIEGDFRGTTTGNSNGGFQIRHAWMKLKWPGMSEVMIGQNWQQWGMPYYPAMIGANDFAQYNKGVRQPQIAWRYFFTKEFNTMLGLIAATDYAGNAFNTSGVRQFNDGYARSNWPGLMGEIAYYTDRCGKIGPNNLKFAFGGYYGRNKLSYDDPTNAAKYKDDTIGVWQATFRYSVPILPEKQGNKQMALLLNGNFFIGQDPGGAGNIGSPGWGQGAYQWADAANNVRAVAPTYFGLFSQLTWWLTNNVQFNAMYGYFKYNYSEAARIANPDNNNMGQTYAANILWDANQAVRFGLQWMHMFNTYNGKNTVVGTNGRATGPIGVADNNGTIDQFRVAAWYFF